MLLVEMRRSRRDAAGASGRDEEEQEEELEDSKALNYKVRKGPRG